MTDANFTIKGFKSWETDEGGGYQMQAQRAIREQEVKA